MRVIIFSFFISLKAPNITRIIQTITFTSTDPIAIIGPFIEPAAPASNKKSIPINIELD